MQRVVVLLDEVGRLVANGAGEVTNEEAVVVANLTVILQLGLARQS